LPQLESSCEILAAPFGIVVLRFEEKTVIRRLIVAIALLALVGSTTQSVQASRTATVAMIGSARPTQSLLQLRYRGVTRATRPALNLARQNMTGLEVQSNAAERDVEDLKPAMKLRQSFAAAPVPTPTPAGLAVVRPDSNVNGFSGLTHYDQRNAGTGIYTNTQFSLEPPDQGLCVGNNFVVEAINNALAVFRFNGTPVAGPTALSQFWALGPEIVRPSGPFGAFISDPKCYFDQQTQRFFVTELEIDTNPVTGALANHSSVLIGVSQTADPTGVFNLFTFDTTDATNPGCPCFGDQPLLGADANGIYITTNEFPIAGSGFNGSQVYALSKKALVAGSVTTVVHIDAGTLATPDKGGVWYSIQPATTPKPSQFSTVLGGTEFFLSALDFFNFGDRRVAVWSLSNTVSLAGSKPNLSLRNDVLGTQDYSPPVPATQRPGYTPLATSLGEKLETLNTNDDRMNQVVFANGHLWSGVNTAVAFGKQIDSGIAYFDVVPTLTSGGLTALLNSGGYVAVSGENVFFPSIGVTSGGLAILTSSLSGPHFFPSAVYTLLKASGPSNVRLAGPGSLPDDGFTAYAAYGGNGVARWGDYSAAVTDGVGNIWIAAEYIPSAFRTQLANWGTFIERVRVAF
jgi:hypothetical protein